MRTHQLQAIRGLAALLVAIGHCLGLFRTPVWFDQLKNYSNGHAAVVMFFVLSGFVLTLSLGRGTPNPIHFYIKRVFRIYPAWIVACTISFAYLVFVHYRFPISNGSDWWLARFQANRMHPLFIAASYAGMLAFLLPQGWTIFVELVASMLMPFIGYSARRGQVWFYVSLGLALLLSLTVGAGTYYGLWSYLVDFFLGAWLAAPPNWLLAVVRRAERWTIPGLLFALAVLLSFRNIFPPGDALDVAAYNNGPTQLVEAVCCVWILAVVIHGKHPLKILDSKALSWLGEVSFSFYLVHVPIMCLLAQAIDPIKMDNVYLSLLLLALTLPISLLLSTGMYRFIEKPGIDLGKRLLSKLPTAPTPLPKMALETPGPR